VGVYLAVGDSMSIDAYTGVDGGGAASQLARKLRLELLDLTADGNTTDGVLADLARAPAAAEVVTLTAGGNDLLFGGELPDAILGRLHEIAEPLGARVVISTVYDPSDGDDELGRRELGLSSLEIIELRRRLNALNRGIAEVAAQHDFLLADIERLFHGHGVASDRRVVGRIEFDDPENFEVLVVERVESPPDATVGGVARPGPSPGGSRRPGPGVCPWRPFAQAGARWRPMASRIAEPPIGAT
jgi:hypothetical protein